MLQNIQMTSTKQPGIGKYSCYTKKCVDKWIEIEDFRSNIFDSLHSEGNIILECNRNILYIMSILTT